MKTQTTSAGLDKWKWSVRLTFLFLVMHSVAVKAQTCANPADVIYGLSNTGFIYPLPISSGAMGGAINPAYTGNAPVQSNGLGYSQLNGKFYYFKRPPGSAPQEFVSF